jgi:hypothetical protein
MYTFLITKLWTVAHINIVFYSSRITETTPIQWTIMWFVYYNHHQISSLIRYFGVNEHAVICQYIIFSIIIYIIDQISIIWSSVDYFSMIFGWLVQCYRIDLSKNLMSNLIKSNFFKLTFIPKIDFGSISLKISTSKISITNKKIVEQIVWNYQ